ncbi:MAG: DUF1805 domain-containing protein [Bacillota bacterium]|nr:DUF1805 domain-containing protein [Bacillota bacterium]
MVQIVPLDLGDFMAVGVVVELPRTRLLAISAGDGYIMCGALDVHLLNTRLSDRGVVAARAVGVRTLPDLLEAPLESVTFAAQALGIHPGLSGRNALYRMARYAGLLRE